MGLQDVKNGRGIVHAVDFDAFASDGKEDASCAAGDFEDWAAGLAGESEIERQVDESSKRGIGGIVVLGGDVVGVGVVAHGSSRKLYMSLNEGQRRRKNDFGCRAAAANRQGNGSECIGQRLRNAARR